MDMCKYCGYYVFTGKDQYNEPFYFRIALTLKDN